MRRRETERERGKTRGEVKGERGMEKGEGRKAKDKEDRSRNVNWGFSRRNCKATWRETESGQQKMCHNYLGWRMVETLKIFYKPFRIR